jgi:uroporphyrinogen III methyltransferase / synthase
VTQPLAAPHDTGGGAASGRPTVVITRPAGQSAELISALAAQGIDAFEFPLIDIADAADNAPLVEAFSMLQRYALAVFVSPNAVDRAFASIAGTLPAFTWPADVPVAVVGPGSAKALARHGIVPGTHRIIAPGGALASGPLEAERPAGGGRPFVPAEPPRADDSPAVQVSSDSYARSPAPAQSASSPVSAPSASGTPRYDSEALLGAIAAAFAPHGLAALKDRRVLLVRGDGGRELLADTLRAQGTSVDAIAAYRRALPEPRGDAWRRVHALLAGARHAWLLTSSEGVRNLDELAREHLNPDEIAALKHASVVTSHPRIGETARNAGFDRITVSGAGDHAVVGALRAVFSPVNQEETLPKTQSQTAQSRMTDSKDSQAPSSTASSPARPGPAVPPNVPFTPYEVQKPRRSAGALIAWIIVVLLLAAAGVGGYALNRKVDRIQQQLAARQQANDAQTAEMRLKTQQALDSVHQVDSQAAQLGGRITDLQTQQQALQASLQDLAKNRDEWTLAEVEQMISAASQQLQLTGNVPLALFALQSADTRLAASNGPQVIAVRKAIAQDIDKLKATPNIDLAGLAIKLDDVIGQLDSLPLAGETPVAQASPHASTPADVGKLAAATGEPRWKAWWRTFSSGIAQQLTSLVQVRRIDNADAMLVAPDQGYFLRENLKLRLLSARLALLSRDEALMNSDLQAADRALAHYFDSSAAATRNARDLIAQVKKGGAHVQLPNLDTSLNAIHQVKSRG